MKSSTCSFCDSSAEMLQKNHWVPHFCGFHEMSDVTKANDGIYLSMQQRAIRELAVRKIIESTLKITDSHLKTSLRTGHHCIDTSCGADLPWSTKVVERQRGFIRTHESSKCTIENHEIPWRVTLCHLDNWGETKEKNSNKTKETLQQPSFKGKHSITKHENLFGYISPRRGSCLHILPNDFGTSFSKAQGQQSTKPQARKIELQITMNEQFP